MKKRHKLIVFGIIVIFFLLGLIIFLEMHSRPEIDLRGQPTVGEVSAPVRIISFEDPLCPLCIKYSLEIFPKIKENFIDTGRVKYSLILVSFLKDSQSNALAALCVHHTYPPLFFPFMDALFAEAEQGSYHPSLIWRKAAEQIPELDLNLLSDCVNTGRYLPDLETNLQLGEAVIGSSFGTPILLINDTVVPALNYEEIATIIDREWEKK